jgi:hypothetical protein
MGADTVRSVAHNRRRELRSVESFKSAADCIGPVVPDMCVFGVTRGQWGAVDAITYLLSQTGPAAVSVWTWCIAQYELAAMESLLQRGDITAGVLVIDQSSDKRTPQFITAWRDRFGPAAVRITRCHAKIYTVANERFKLALRGSFNLNYSPRLEQFDLTEGGADFDLIASIQAELPVLRPGYSSAEVMAAGKLDKAYPPELLAQFVNPGAGPFQELKPWQP